MYLEADHRFKMNLSLAGSRTSHWRFGCWMVLTISLHCLKTSKTTTWMSFNPWKQEQKTCICISYKVNLTGYPKVYILQKKTYTFHPVLWASTGGHSCGCCLWWFYCSISGGVSGNHHQIPLKTTRNVKFGPCCCCWEVGGEKFGGFPPAKIPKNRMARASNFGSDHFFAITYIYIYTVFIYT